MRMIVITAALLLWSSIGQAQTLTAAQASS
jgi:hypothetical protein